MKLTPTQLFDLRKQYQDAKEAREYYQERYHNSHVKEDLEWFDYYEGMLNGIEWTLRNLDLSFDEFSSIVYSGE